jgi:hypothetical protein
MISPLNLSALREAEREATPGVWVCPQGDFPFRDVWLEASPGDPALLTCLSPGDAYFIALARNSLPALLDRIEELEGERGELRERLVRAALTMTDWQRREKTFYREKADWPAAYKLRVAGKVEGVHLAISYLDELERG